MRMQERPEQPPEGRLIAEAADRMNLSIREAARRAGISYGRWRQIVTGYQNVSPGSYAAVHAPARTLARMAAVTGITAERLETEGRRPDAALELAEILRQRADAPEPAARLPGLHRNGDLFPGLSPGLKAEVEPHFREIEARIRVAEAARPEQVLTGSMVFPDRPQDAARWDGLAARGYTTWQLAQALAVIHVLDPAAQAEPSDETASGLTAEEAS
jgi:hypothetical protein